MHGLMGLGHLMGIAAYIGATLLLAMAVESVGRRASDAFDRRNRFAELFRVYNPLSIAALGVAVVTGAMMITGYKESLGAGYFVQVGRPLVGKLTAAFVLIITATWVSFGICHRVVNADLGALPVTDAELDRVLMRLRVALWLSLALAVLTLWLALAVRAPVLAG
jgi:hypothetical protein